MKTALLLFGLMAFALETKASSTGVAVRMNEKDLYEEIGIVLGDINKSLDSLLETIDPTTTIKPTSDKPADTTPDGTNTTPDGTNTTPDGSDGTTTEVSDGITTEVSEDTTTESTEDTTAESTEDTTTEDSTTTEKNDQNPPPNEKNIHLPFKRNLLSIPVMAGLRKNDNLCNTDGLSETNDAVKTCNKFSAALDNIEKNTKIVNDRLATEDTLNELRTSNTQIKEVKTEIDANPGIYENVLNKDSVKQSIEVVKKEVSVATSSANDQVDEEKGDEALVISLSVIFSIIGVGIIGGGVYYFMKKRGH